MDWGILLGLLAIAVAIYFGLWGFRKDITDKLSTINDKLITIGVIADKAWDLISRRFALATVERNLSNLGKTRISAEPSPTVTSYIVEIERPILQQELLLKICNEENFLEKEREIFSKEVSIKATVYSPTRMRIILPCTESKTCTEYMTFVLKWVDSVYFAALPAIKDFEEPILS